jgi:ribonuclease HII
VCVCGAAGYCVTQCGVTPCRAEFIRNNRGINDGKDLPQEYLENLYNEIKNRQIQVRSPRRGFEVHLRSWPDAELTLPTGGHGYV